MKSEIDKGNVRGIRHTPHHANLQTSMAVFYQYLIRPGSGQMWEVQMCEIEKSC